MANTTFDRMVKDYNNFMSNADPRIKDYPFIDSPIPNHVSILIYLFIVTYAGPRFMRHRKPYNLQKIIVVYNFAMVVTSFYVFWEMLAGGWANGYSFTCQLCDYSRSPQAIRMMKACICYWMSKHIEFCDTYFFILRKKQGHVTFFHVFHHAITTFVWYWAVRFSPGGLGTFQSLLNSLVHVVMYFYYGLAALGPAYQKYIWWKKYLTVFQMLQFVIILVHVTNIMIFHDCNYPKPAMYALLSGGFVFLGLFADFWRKAYSKNKRIGKETQINSNEIRPNNIKND